MLELPPLALYVHLPWCVRKCPYCDFNSHPLKGSLPAEQYIDALLKDLELELPLVWGRVVQCVFFGGGTPSLFKAAHFERLLSGCRARLPFSPRAEITLEANPGTVEHDSFSAYRAAGINRVSLGVQSFSERALAAIGRIHGRNEVLRAIGSLRAAGFDNFNLDLMFGLPGQDLAEALEDVRRAIDSAPAHISHYQLTLEPNTAFCADPPALPDQEAAWEMQEACGELLAHAGFAQYEVSAWARPGRECVHNLNYWACGDYLGIGAGAHGKITLPMEGTVRRRIRTRHPTAWMNKAGDSASLADDYPVSPEDRVFEFFLNQLRLRRGVRKSEFEARTGLAWTTVADRAAELVSRGLALDEGGSLTPTELGWRFGNESQAVFLP